MNKIKSDLFSGKWKTETVDEHNDRDLHNIHTKITDHLMWNNIHNYG